MVSVHYRICCCSSASTDWCYSIPRGRNKCFPLALTLSVGVWLRCTLTLNRFGWLISSSKCKKTFQASFGACLMCQHNLWNENKNSFFLSKSVQNVIKRYFLLKETYKASAQDDCFNVHLDWKLESELRYSSFGTFVFGKWWASKGNTLFTSMYHS